MHAQSAGVSLSLPTADQCSSRQTTTPGMQLKQLLLPGTSQQRMTYEVTLLPVLQYTSAEEMSQLCPGEAEEDH